ncbi:DMT family transporter [Mastigocoleus testarum]|uniref:DMT family transporter n=1 Tax=Mastigocoleus testarum TaxID=996925 RepID=UPI001F190709|nr:DMT family transporter [Mastigocoleus testarum]
MESTRRGSKSLLGIFAILLVMVIYTANFVVTRYSILNGLNSLDLAALRYSVSGIVMLPYFYRLGWKNLGGLGWSKAILLTCLAGSPYILVFFFGLSFAPASHGAVLNPGIVPSVVFLGMVFLGLQSFSLARVLSLVSIFLGVVLVTASSFSLQGSVLFGDFLLLVTGISWGLFTLLAKVWELRPMQSTAIVSVISLLYLPPYLLFWYNGFESASTAHIISQAIFQGIIMSIGTIYLVTYAVQSLGAQLTSLFSPLVPVLTTLIAIPLLGEIPTSLQWIGIVLVVLGMLRAAKINS